MKKNFAQFDCKKATNVLLSFLDFGVYGAANFWLYYRIWHRLFQVNRLITFSRLGIYTLTGE